MSEIRLDGRVAIVTGAGRGLGREHALLLAARGAAVVVNDVADADAAEATPAQEVVDRIRQAGGTAVVDETAVGTPQAAARIVELATSTYGRLDILVNNAGILRDRSFAKMSAQEYEAVMQVHMGGTFWMSKAAWPVMTEQRYGRVVNTTSVAGLFGNFGQANYAGAKAGIIGITKTLAIEGARNGIQVNAIEPGARTRMTQDLLGDDLADSLDPSLVAPLVLWLSAQECGSSGEVYNVGGGRVARVVVAQTPGLFARNLTPEQVRDAWKEINDDSAATVITDSQHELRILTDLLSGR